jgi:hypothetical protein
MPSSGLTPEHFLKSARKYSYEKVVAQNAKREENTVQEEAPVGI